MKVRTLLIATTLIAVGLGLIVWLNARVSQDIAERTAVQKVAVREQIDPNSLKGSAHAMKDGWLVIVLPDDDSAPQHWIVTVNHAGKVEDIKNGI